MQYKPLLQTCVLALGLATMSLSCDKEDKAPLEQDLKDSVQTNLDPMGICNPPGPLLDSIEVGQTKCLGEYQIRVDSIVGEGCGYSCIVCFRPLPRIVLSIRTLEKEIKYQSFQYTNCTYPDKDNKITDSITEIGLTLNFLRITSDYREPGTKKLKLSISK